MSEKAAFCCMVGLPPRTLPLQPMRTHRAGPPPAPGSVLQMNRLHVLDFSSSICAFSIGFLALCDAVLLTFRQVFSRASWGVYGARPAAQAPWFGGYAASLYAIDGLFYAAVVAAQLVQWRHRREARRRWDASQQERQQIIEEMEACAVGPAARQQPSSSSLDVRVELSSSMERSGSSPPGSPHGRAAAGDECHESMSLHTPTDLRRGMPPASLHGAELAVLASIRLGRQLEVVLPSTPEQRARTPPSSPRLVPAAPPLLPSFSPSLPLSPRSSTAGRRALWRASLHQPRQRPEQARRARLAREAWRAVRFLWCLAGWPPWDIVVLTYGGSLAVWVSVCMFRLMRLVHMPASTSIVYWSLRYHADISVGWSRLASYMVLYLLLLHLTACGYMAVGVSADGATYFGWQLEDPLLKGKLSDEWTLYLRSLYQAASVVTGIGFGDQIPHTLTSMGYSIVVAFVCTCYVSNAMIGLVLAQLVWVDSMSLAWQKRVETAEHFIQRRRVPRALAQRVREYLQYQWIFLRGVDESTFFAGLPGPLRTEVLVALNDGLTSHHLPNMAGTRRAQRWADPTHTEVCPSRVGSRGRAGRVALPDCLPAERVPSPRVDTLIGRHRRGTDSAVSPRVVACARPCGRGWPDAGHAPLSFGRQRAQPALTRRLARPHPPSLHGG